MKWRQDQDDRMKHEFRDAYADLQDIYDEFKAAYGKDAYTQFLDSCDEPLYGYIETGGHGHKFEKSPPDRKLGDFIDVAMRGIVAGDEYVHFQSDLLEDDGCICPEMHRTTERYRRERYRRDHEHGVPTIKRFNGLQGRHHPPISSQPQITTATEEPLWVYPTFDPWLCKHIMSDDWCHAMPIEGWWACHGWVPRIWSAGDQ